MQSNVIDEHVDNISLEFLNNVLGYEEMMKQEVQKKSKKQNPEKMIVESDKEIQVREWAKKIKPLLDFVYYLDYKQLKDVLILSISVPLFLPSTRTHNSPTRGLRTG